MFGMGRTLLHDEPSFASDRAMRAGAAAAYRLVFDRGAGRHDTAESRLSDVDVIQPALFAVQVASQRCGVHGVSNRTRSSAIAWRSRAAYVSGALSLEDAALIICTRSKLVKRTVGKARWRRWSSRSKTLGARSRLRRSRFNRGQHQSYIDGAVGRSRGARGDTRTASGPRRLLPDGEGGLRLAQSADGFHCATS